jgi:hypothetical protein
MEPLVAIFATADAPLICERETANAIAIAAIPFLVEIFILTT